MVRGSAGSVDLVWVQKNSTKQRNPEHLVGISGAQSQPRVWKRLRHLGHSLGVLADVKRRRLDWQDEGFVPVQNRTGVG